MNKFYYGSFYPNEELVIQKFNMQLSEWGVQVFNKIEDAKAKALTFPEDFSVHIDVENKILKAENIFDYGWVYEVILNDESKITQKGNYFIVKDNLKVQTFSKQFSQRENLKDWTFILNHHL